MRTCLTFVLILSVLILSVLMCCASIDAAENLIRNGTFSEGEAQWSDLGADANHEAAITEVEGRKVLRLKRLTEGASVSVNQWNLRFKPQTWYRLSVTGYGTGPAMIAVRPQSSKDPGFEKVSKSWATSSGPMPISTTPVTETLMIDSGLKADNGYFSAQLGSTEVGSYTITAVSLEEICSSKPNSAETVIVHIGDSFTSTVYLPFSQRIQTLLAATMAKDLPGRVIRNLSVAADGEWVADLLESKRYEKVIKENYAKIDIAVIRYGCNDQIHKYSPEDFKKQVVILCDNLERDYPGIKLVLGTGTYLHNGPDVNKQYGAHWQVMRDVATERKYPLADIYQRFEKEDSDKSMKVPGDMHPSPYGVTLMADVVYSALKPLLLAKTPK